ncbi:hypothetical protein BMOU_0759 [Bifidobacterium moukalabense DSM 27321]|uniref:Uncharacterized protein n=2 Tax=Bifidobacterium moukalabense TaxID=1333651 RepID=W4NA02_9BIFI|nr:hypothetical protein BMOU_0808 [Bifidobacterium moukalabense DSM 27321]ETY71681.1 hypothetical protein BMOU_0759 [Bifidobacterium moukalabense DSM 27321]
MSAGAMIGGKTVAGMAFGGVSIAGLCKAGTVIWRKPKPEWTDQTDKIFAVSTLTSGMTLTKAGDGDYLLAVSETIANGTRIIGSDWIPKLGDMSADWPTEGTVRLTYESTVKVGLNGGLGWGEGTSFQVETATKAEKDVWWGFWTQQELSPGTYHLHVKFETKSA